MKYFKSFILLFILIFCLVSFSYADTKEEEKVKINSVKIELARYVNTHKFCFIPEQCGDTNLNNLNEMVNIIKNHGWKDNEMNVALVYKEKKNIFSLYIILKCKVHENRSHFIGTNIIRAKDLIKKKNVI